MIAMVDINVAINGAIITMVDINVAINGAMIAIEYAHYTAICLPVVVDDHEESEMSL
jgi:uncharacterized membrane protein